MICPKCHAETSEQSKFCRRCGADLRSVRVQSTQAQSEVTRCPGCGREVSPGKRFCSSCGSEVAAPKDLQEPSHLPAPSSATPTRPNPPASPTARAAAKPLQPATGVRPAPSASFSQKPSAPPAIGPLAESQAPKKPISRGGIAALLAVIVLLVAAGMWYALGVNLDITTNPGEVRIVIDGRTVGVTTAQGGIFSISHLKRGSHLVTLFRPGYEPWSKKISLGFFELSRHLTVKLPIPSYPISVITTPGRVRVRLDGKDVGSTDASGHLQIPNVPRGEHTVTVSADGYPSTGQRFYLQAPDVVRIDLAALEANVRRREAAMINQAHAFYRQRQFSAAIAKCDAVLKFDPKNQSAASLKKQIEQTENILGGK